MDLLNSASDSAALSKLVTERGYNQPQSWGIPIIALRLFNFRFDSHARTIQIDKGWLLLRRKLKHPREHWPSGSPLPESPRLASRAYVSAPQTPGC